MGWFIPFTSCAVTPQCYVAPVEYVPGKKLAQQDVTVRAGALTVMLVEPAP